MSPVAAQPRYRSLESFIHWQAAERPLHWAERFGRAAPLELEIGFGNGEYLVHRAKEQPDTDFIGVELRWASVLRALRRSAKLKLPNVRVCMADAHTALERLIQPGALQKATALFPCPWPKERHERHRLFSRPFLQLLNSRLVAAGSMLVITDDADFRDWILQQVPGTGFAAAWTEVAPQARTVYERRWEKSGQTAFYSLALSKHTPISAALKEDANVNTHKIAQFDAARFFPESVRGDITVEFKEFLYDPIRKKAMSRVMIVEEHMLQDIWIEILRDGEEWKIRPAWGCRMVPTAGVQLALDKVRDAAGGSPAATALQG